METHTICKYNNFNRITANGGMREWLKRAVLKTAVPETVPGVRIPLPPPASLKRRESSACRWPHLTCTLGRSRLTADQSNRAILQDFRGGRCARRVREPKIPPARLSPVD